MHFMIARTLFVKKNEITIAPHYLTLAVMSFSQIAKLHVFILYLITVTWLNKTSFLFSN